ncbi:MAG TPA: copper homeostasis protein CutC [Bacteroidota bacterium]|nr:copper homeostasis protein CutC [Bacteroidota bacterium]
MPKRSAYGGRHDVLLEVCVDSVASAIAAERGGADRIELCANLHEGGTTPSAGTIELAVKHCSIPVHVLVRPRAGGFCYGGTDLLIMKRDIAVAKKLGAAGVVIGILTQGRTIDVVRMRALIMAARPMSVTFHRAFDAVKNPMKSLEQIIEAGADRLLTSGQKSSAEKGVQLIAELVRRAGGRIAIMAGAGVNEKNAKKIVEETGVREIHVGSAVAKKSAHDRLGFGAKREVDVEKVKRIVRAVR